MATLITDAWLEERLKAERAASGADRYDEVWEGVYLVVSPPNSEHQEIVARLSSVLQNIIGWPGVGDVFAGVNLSDRRGDDWEYDFRIPDVAVFLHGGTAEDCDTHWCGAADFLVEITNAGDRTREKIPFYGQLGVAELLLIDREPWTLELYRQQAGQLTLVDRSNTKTSGVLASNKVPLTFQLVSGDPRPQIEVKHVDSGRSWLV